MICSQCNFKNPDDMNFCGKCGASLAAAEDLPGYTRRSPLNYTPQFLLDKVLKTRSSMAGERKMVTVLFADVAGFTTISEMLDPEDVHEIMDGCFEILGQEIHKVGGTINQYTGDGVMALFGAPIAYEDHPHRACHAALRIQQRMAAYSEDLKLHYTIQFQLRIGINTGMVVVGAIGDNLRLDYTAVGDTTNLAARLESQAPPGGILISGAVAEFVHDAFELESIGKLAVKGKREAVQGFLLIGEHDEALPRKGAPEGSLTFVGRENERAALKEALGQALRGRPCLVQVAGEPGIGKTFLLQQFRKDIGHSVHYLEGRGRTYGQATAYYPLLQMLRSYFNLSEHDSPSRINRLIQKRITKKSQGEAMGRLFEFLHTPRDDILTQTALPEGNKREIFHTLRDFLVSAAEIKPLCLVFDDMQWVDASTREFLSYFFSTVSNAAALAVLIGRLPLKDWTLTEAGRTIELSPLPEKVSMEILDTLLGTDRLDTKAASRILGQAGGNPLFLVEMGASLKQQELLVCDSWKCTIRLPLEELEMPETIHAVLAARLDTLPDEAKRLAQEASVIGYVFSYDILNKLTGHPQRLRQLLVHLEHEGVIEQISGRENQYQFHHRMLREVAYHGLLRRHRMLLHGRIGEILEESYRDNLGAVTGILAEHFYQAQKWPKALAYTLEAGQQAARSYGCHEALACFDRGLSILSHGSWDHKEETELQIYEWKGKMHSCVGQIDSSRKSFQKMLDLAERLEDNAARAEALFRLGWVSFFEHRPASAAERLSEAIGLSKKSGLSDIGLKATSLLGYLYAVLGKLGKARPLFIDALDLMDGDAGLEGKAWTLAYLSQYYNWMGEFGEALELTRQLDSLNQVLNSPYFRIVLRFRLGLIHTAMGKLEEAKKILQEGLEALEVGDEKFWLPRFLNTLGWMHAEAGEPETALKLNRDSLREALLSGDPETINNARINVGQNLIEMGELDSARDELEKLWTQVKKPGLSYTKWRCKTRLLVALANLYERCGEREKSLRFANNAISHARSTGSKKHLAQALMIKGRAIRQTRPSAAKAAFEEASSLARTMGAPLLEDRIAGDIRNNPV